MILSFHPCFVADHQILLGDQLPGRNHMRLIQEASAILLPQGCSQELYRVCKDASARVFPNYDARFQYAGKIGQGRFFRKMGWPHPVTRLWNSVDQWKKFCAQAGRVPHRMPFLLKVDRSHEGEGVFLVRDGAGLESSLKILLVRERSGSYGFVSQELVPSDGNVLRVVVMGKKRITYWKRPSREGEIVTTLSRGAWLDKEWRPDLQEKGVTQGGHVWETSGINLAAMDFVFPLSDPDPQPLILEINYYFGRRGLGGSLVYYRLLYGVIREWLAENGFDPDCLDLV